MPNIKIHTGCSCGQCRAGKNSKVRADFHRKVRRVHKHELKQKGEIDNVILSIGYTD